ncbi:MAG: LysM domain/BON superfamily protein [Lacunisphaera sp.]|nr:LysM domain/BON superfamily protein [Lacunisphaera sp.]
MSRPVVPFRFVLPLLLAAAALVLAACGGDERLSYATEVDEPAYREGTALLKTGRKQEALNAFLKVIDKRGEDAPESHLSVGLLYAEDIRDPLSAIYHFKKFLALRPNSPQAPLVRQRIDAAMRDFARTLPDQPLENQLNRVDLVAALDRLKQENAALKQELADVKAGRATAGTLAVNSDIPATTAPQGGFNFSLETVPVVRTRAPAPAPPPPATRRPSTAAKPAVAPGAKNPPPAAATHVAGRRHTVMPGDTLSKLAQQYYGNRAKWRDIYAANRDVMKSESDLRAGVELKIP